MQFPPSKSRPLRALPRRNAPQSSPSGVSRREKALCVRAGTAGLEGRIEPFVHLTGGGSVRPILSNVARRKAEMKVSKAAKAVLGLSYNFV